MARCGICGAVVPDAELLEHLAEVHDAAPQISDAPIHVVPEGDLRDHAEEALCPCLPLVDGDLIVHNSYDGREIGEVCRAALDALGLVLAENSITWSPEARRKYEHAIHVLNMHYPDPTPRAESETEGEA